MNIPAVLIKTGGLYVKLDYVECPDKSRCLDYETCCPISDWEYGCCPMRRAVCCDDRKHCCPSGFRCEEESNTCSMKGLRIPMLMNRKSSRQQTQSKVNLDDKIRFTPGKPKDTKNMENVGAL